MKKYKERLCKDIVEFNKFVEIMSAEFKIELISYFPYNGKFMAIYSLVRKGG